MYIYIYIEILYTYIHTYIRMYVYTHIHTPTHKSESEPLLQIPRQPPYLFKILGVWHFDRLGGLELGNLPEIVPISVCLGWE